MQNHFQFTLLGVQIEIKSNSEVGYMEEVLRHLENKIASTQEGLRLHDPLKTAILTSFLLVDDLLSERSQRVKHVEISLEESKEAEKITKQIIDDLKELEL